MDAEGSERTVAPMAGYEYLPYLAGAISAAAAIPAARFASKLTAAQPIEADVDAEADMLAAVLAEPKRYRQCVEARPEDFTWEPYARLWALISATSTPCSDQAEIDEAEKYGVEARTITLDSDELAAKLRAAGADTGVLAELAERSVTSGHLEAGGKVLAAAHDRNTYVGATRITTAANPTREAPLERHLVAPSRGRQIFAACVAGAGAAAAVWAAGATIAAAATLVLWVAVLVVLALVDYDTLYIDMRLYWAGTAAVTAAALTTDGATDRLANAAIWGIGAAAAMWIIAVGYGKLRGIAGLGSGDVFLTAPLFGIPILLGADPQAALWGLLAGMVISIVVVGVAVIAGRRSKDTPFAFGPYLAVGWPFGWALFELLNR